MTGTGTLARVYPRVYGGTVSSLLEPNPNPGLSPRVRGNLLHLWRPQGVERSIPACTGEPAPRPCTWSAWRVYPRVYGGTPCNLQIFKER